MINAEMTPGILEQSDIPDCVNGNSDLSLISRYRSGDMSAATELYRRYQQRVNSHVARMMTVALKAREDPDDVTQWVFAYVFNEMKSADETLLFQGRLWPLMAAIAKNVVCSRARYWSAERRDFQRTSRMPGPDSLEAGNDDSPEYISILKDVLQSLLGAFPPERRRILSLLLQGYSQVEVARECGCSEYRVCTTKKAAARVLSRHFSDMDCRGFAI